jgi:hypothetical protein
VFNIGHTVLSIVSYRTGDSDDSIRVIGTRVLADGRLKVSRT